MSQFGINQVHPICFVRSSLGTTYEWKKGRRIPKLTLIEVVKNDKFIKEIIEDMNRIEENNRCGQP